MSSRSPSSRRSKERSSRRSPSPRDNDRYKQRSSYVNNRPQSNYHRNNQWQPRNNNGGGGYNNYYQRNRWQGNYRGRGYSRPYNNYNRGGGNNNYRNNQSHSQSYNRHRRTRSRGSRSRSRSRSYSRSRSRGRSYSKSRSRSYSSRSRSGSRVSKSNRSRSGSPAAITSKPAGLEALAYFRGNSYSGDSDTGKNGGKTSSSTEAVQSKTDKDNTSNKLEESALASVERHRNNLTEMIKQQANTKSSLTYQEAVKESGDKTAKSKQIKTFSINSSINKTQLVTRLYSSSDENSENEATKRKILPKRRRLEDSNRVIEIHDDDGERQHVESTKHRGGGGGGPSNTSHTSDKNSSSTATSVEPKSQAKEDDSAAAAATSKLLSQLGGLKVVGPDGKPMNLIAVTVPDGDGKMMQVLQIPATIDQPLPSSTARHGASGEKIASSSDRMEVDNTGDGQKEMGEKRKPWSNTVVTYPGNYMSEGGVNAGAGDTQGYNYTSNAPDYNDPGSTQFGFQTTKKAVDLKTSSRNDDDFTDPKYVAATPAASQNLTNETTKTGEPDEKKSKNKSASVVRKEISADEEDNEDYLDLGKGKKKKKKSKKNKRAASSDGGGKDKKKKKKKKSKKSGVDDEKLSGYEEFKLKHEQAGRREDTLKRDLPATLPLAHIRGVLIRKSDEGKVSLFNHVLDKKKQKEAVVRTVEEQFVSLFADETDQKEEEEEEPVEKLDMSLRALRKLQLHLPTPRKVNHRTEITINNRLENMMTETQKKKKKSALKEQIVQQVSVNLAGLSKSAKKRKKSKTRSPSPAEVVVKVDSSGKRGYRERVVRSSSSSSASQSPSPPPRSKRHRHSRSKSRSLPQAYKRSDGGNDKQDGSDDERYRRDGSSSRSRSRDRERSSGGGNNRLASYNNQQTYQSRNFYNNNSNRYQRGRGNYNNNFNNRGNFRGRFNNNNNYRGGYNNHRGGYNNNRGGGYNNNRGGSYFNQYYNNNSNRNQQQQGQNDWRTSRRDDNHREHERHRSTRDNRSDSREADRYSSGGESEHENRSSIQKSNKETNKKEAPIVILSSPEHSSKEQAVDASVRLKKMNEPWTHDMYEEQEAEANRD